MPELPAVKKPWALITGGSRGLGFALARECVRYGYNLFLISRTEETLQQAADTLRSEGDCRVEILPMDLTRDHAVQEVSRALKERGVVPQMWVNNAGTARYERFAHVTFEEETGMTRLNILSLTAMTRLALKTMEKGYLVNVASTAAFAPGPGSALYYATKSFVLNFTLALAYEEAKAPVTISVLCPGPLDTELLKKRGNKGKRASFLIMDPEKAARYALKKVLRGKKLVIPGLLNQAVVLCARFLPLDWITKLIGRSNLR